MPVQYTNRKGQTYYLHRGTDKSGQPTYYFSMKKAGSLAESIPQGYEIYENPNALVYLRKIQPGLITEEEVTLVKQSVERYALLEEYQIHIKKNMIVVYTPAQDIKSLLELLSSIPIVSRVGARGVLTRTISYSPELRFVLTDPETRIFQTERYSNLGSIDDWIEIGKPDDLAKLVKNMSGILGKIPPSNDNNCSPP